MDTELDSSNDKMKCLYRFVIVFILISVICMFFVRVFVEPQSQRTIDAAMNGMAYNMSERVLLIHNIWQTSGKGAYFYPPKWLNLYNGVDSDNLGFDPKKISFLISDEGWPKDIIGINGINSPCARLWRGILGKKMKLFIEDVRIVHNPESQICIFKTSVSGFIYNYSNGTVIKQQNYDFDKDKDLK